MHFLRHILDFWTIFKDSCVATHSEKQPEEDKTPSVAPIVWTCWMWISAVFILFTFVVQFLLFRQNWWRNDRKEKERLFNLQRFSPLLPSFFPHILPRLSVLLGSVTSADTQITSRRTNQIRANRCRCRSDLYGGSSLPTEKRSKEKNTKSKKQTRSLLKKKKSFYFLDVTNLFSWHEWIWKLFSAS